MHNALGHTDLANLSSGLDWTGMLVFSAYFSGVSAFQRCAKACHDRSFRKGRFFERPAQVCG